MFVLRLLEVLLPFLKSNGVEGALVRECKRAKKGVERFFFQFISLNWNGVDFRN
jgi:hypothetical protein